MAASDLTYYDLLLQMCQSGGGPRRAAGLPLGTAVELCGETPQVSRVMMYAVLYNHVRGHLVPSARARHGTDLLLSWRAGSRLGRRPHLAVDVPLLGLQQIQPGARRRPVALGVHLPPGNAWIISGFDLATMYC